MNKCVAILGRPNVGKSTLFNRIAGKRLAIVQDTPGVTRDWQETQADFFGLEFTLMDTPGLFEVSADHLQRRLWDHTLRALEKADILLFVLDAREGLTPEDQALSRWARSTGKPILVLANKCEGSHGFRGLFEAFQMGLGDPIAVSAAHGEGLGELAEALGGLLGPQANPGHPTEDTPLLVPEVRPLRLAVVGRPNVGKSTFLNKLIQKERLLSGPEAGLTRDAVYLPWNYNGREILLSDTAGLRRAAHIKESLEKMSVAGTMEAIRFAHVVVVMMDATQAFERQDNTIAAHVIQEGRALVIALNKWDAVENPKKVLEELTYQLSIHLPQVKGVPLLPLSAGEGKGLHRLMKAVFAVEKAWKTRVSTGALNRFLTQKLAAHAPPLVKGRRIKPKYMTQIKSGPPTFVLFGTQVDVLPGSYQNYLLNGLRETFDFQGVPLRLILKTPENPFGDKD